MLTLITPPATLPVSLSEASEHVRAVGTIDDVPLTQYLEAATEAVERATGRRLISQTWHLNTYADRVPWCIPIPLAPVSAVSSVTYRDLDGESQTLDPALYELRDSEVVRAYGATWPSGRNHAVTFVVGYGDAGDVPAPLKQAIKMIAAAFYEGREAGTLTHILGGVEDLINPYREWRFG